MVEIVFLVLALVTLYAMKDSIKQWAGVQSNKAEIWASEQAVDQQDDLVNIDKRVKAIKDRNGKWYTIDDIRSEMS